MTQLDKMAAARRLAWGENRDGRDPIDTPEDVAEVHAMAEAYRQIGHPVRTSEDAARFEQLVSEAMRAWRLTQPN